MAIEKHNSRLIRGNCIGKGSYGTVSLGVRDSDGGVFAVKSAAKDSLSSLEALENEIRVLRSLVSSSPYIVEFYGDDETPSHRNLYLEYVSGGDVSRAGRIADVELVRSYTWCLVMALKSVHSQGFVHCDVKGSNVLLDSGTTGIAKLADFGTAKKRSDYQRQEIVPRGSPLWMAPEVVRRESQGFEADIWSLGCTVLEMFTGKPAWQDNGPHTLFQIGYSNDLPEYPARLPDLARDFLDKCLDRNPDRRWSCDQLQQHPFLLPAPASKITESSPRSILDNWHNLDGDDDHDGHWFESGELDEILISASERFSKLATTAGVNWESDGWVDVRGISSEFVGLDRGKVGISEFTVGANSEDHECESEESDCDCDCATWVDMDGGDENSGGDRHHGSCCQSGVADSCGGVRREKILALATTAVLLGVFFSSILFYYYSCILLQILDLIKITIYVRTIAMVKVSKSLILAHLQKYNILLECQIS